MENVKIFMDALKELNLISALVVLVGIYFFWKNLNNQMKEYKAEIKEFQTEMKEFQLDTSKNFADLRERTGRIEGQLIPAKVVYLEDVKPKKKIKSK